MHRQADGMPYQRAPRLRGPGPRRGRRTPGALEADQLEFTAGVLRNACNDTLQVLRETGRPHNTGHRGPPGGRDGVGPVGRDGWAVPALLVFGFGGPEPAVGQLSLQVASDFPGRHAFTRPSAAGLRPLRDPSTDEKAADDENN
ncbi:hypothetical protein ACFWPV_36800 [Streptomyces uncialis]|uniref:hypothetical protein n=1 Tax=Streptomyces uncialis TaxID=1048205 RepID=UPI00364BEC76